MTSIPFVRATPLRRARAWVTRRRFGVASLASGAALLLYAGAGWARGAVRRDALRAEWERNAAHREVMLARATSANPVAPLDGAPFGRIVIPRLGIDEVFVEGVHEDDLSAGPGHVPGSAFPGTRGNAVVSAHRDRHFHALADVTIGDTITTETDYNRVSWVVTGRKISPSNVFLRFEAASPVLTLTTCWPIRWVGPAPERLIVTARPISQ